LGVKKRGRRKHLNPAEEGGHRGAERKKTTPR